MNKEIGKLQVQIEDAANLDEKVKLINQAAFKHIHQDNTRAIKLYEEALQLTKKCEGRLCFENRAEALLQLGKLNADLGDFNAALSYISESIPITEFIGDLVMLATHLRYYGTTFGLLTEYNESLKHLFRALTISRQSRDKEIGGAILRDIGHTLIQLNRSDEALEYLIDSLDLVQASEPLKDPLLISSIEDSICQAYSGLGDYLAALEYGLRSVEKAKEISPASAAESLLGVGRVYWGLEIIEKARESFQESLALAEEYNLAREQSLAHYHLGDLLTTLQEYDLAKVHLTRSLELAAELNLTQPQYETLHALYRFYKAQDQFEPALNHFEMYQQLKEESQHVNVIETFKDLQLETHIQTAKEEARAYQQNIESLRFEIKQRERLQDELETVASTDHLTGLLNRGTFFNQAEQILDQAQSKRRPLAIMMLDIDHFKMVNDTYGHRIGDQVLKELAKRIYNSLRAVDLCGRYGGEEFAIMLENTNLKVAVEIGERIRNTINETPFKTDKAFLDISASLGIAGLENGTVIKLEKFLEYADQAMYKAKQNGRDQIQIYAAEG